MKVLLTGIAGFIGSQVARKLISRGDEVVGIDNLNSYYDTKLKKDRINLIKKEANSLDVKFSFFEKDISSKEDLEECFNSSKFDYVINLAAQAGVRQSLKDPDTYVQSNLVGFVNILEFCRHKDVRHLIYASTSSVYGLNTHLPFSERSIADHPAQLYAATKKSNELMAHSYSHLFGLPTTGLRFFTVYGPWGRPDMALFLFTKSILEGKPIQVFNEGKHTRDFTYIDDIVSGIILASDKVPESNTSWSSSLSDPSISSAPYRIYNIGNGEKVNLIDYIECIEKELGKKAKKELLPLQQGDIPDSLADISSLTKDTGYRPQISYREGIKNFISWYKEYYKVS